jgi:ribosomal protein S27AE
MILESWREFGCPQKIRYEVPDSVKPRDASYYDLIRTPHGHTPAPKLRFWKWLSVPVKELRDGNSFTCPNCGEGSFFKTWTYCNNCRDYLDWDDYPSVYNAKREKRRRLLKDVECALLPLLILFGKAWYMPSTRNKWYGEELHVKEIPDTSDVLNTPHVTGPLDKYLEKK